MPRSKNPWFRFYTEAMTDRKIRRLTNAQRWLWIAILCAACDSPEPGRLLVAGGLPMTARELAEYADVSPKCVPTAIQTMTQLEMISLRDGVLEVTNWGSRQFASDHVTARTAAHRARAKERSNTVPTEALERSRNVRRNGPETETETETEVLTSVTGGEVPTSTREAPPSPFCSRHPNGTEDNCGGCATARRRAEQWHAEQAAQEAARRTADARARANCQTCGGGGWIETTDGRPARKCRHHLQAIPGSAP